MLQRQNLFGSDQRKGARIRMNFDPIREPIKILGAYISYDQQKNNEANFFSRIQKNED